MPEIYELADRVEGIGWDMLPGYVPAMVMMMYSHCYFFRLFVFCGFKYVSKIYLLFIKNNIFNYLFQLFHLFHLFHINIYILMIKPINSKNPTQKKK